MIGGLADLALAERARLIPADINLTNFFYHKAR
jgi:hypothetical protein